MLVCKRNLLSHQVIEQPHCQVSQEGLKSACSHWWYLSALWVLKQAWGRNYSWPSLVLWSQADKHPLLNHFSQAVVQPFPGQSRSQPILSAQLFNLPLPNYFTVLTIYLVFDFPKTISKICQQIVVELEKERNHISHLGALGPQYYLCFGCGCQSQVRAKSLVKVWVKSQWFNSSPSLAFLAIEGCLGHGYETHLWLPCFVPNPVSANSSAMSSLMLWWGNKALPSAQYSHQD